jgi:heptosyltransferase-1
MNILLIKTSSLGDIIHTLPALTDAAQAVPGIKFDWVVEENFAEIPGFHPDVNKIIPIAWRQWRKSLLKSWRYGNFRTFYQQLREKTYDKVLDAQGLLKSALITRVSLGQRWGLDFKSARETVVAFFYQKRVKVDFQQHAVARMRQLFALSLGYPLPETKPDYGIKIPESCCLENVERSRQVLFLHGTAHKKKEWPEHYWRSLAKKCVAEGAEVLLSWGNVQEQQRAERIAAGIPGVHLLPKSHLLDLAIILRQVSGAIAVDTGLGHLAAALGTPTVSLYGPTDPQLIGACGDNQIHLRAPLRSNGVGDMLDLLPEMVWESWNNHGTKLC